METFQTSSEGMKSRLPVASNNGEMDITHRIRTLVCIYTDFESAAVVEYLRDDHGKLAGHTR